MRLLPALSMRWPIRKWSTCLLERIELRVYGREAEWHGDRQLSGSYDRDVSDLWPNVDLLYFLLLR